MNRRIYCDYAASTPIDPRVKEAMVPFFDVHFGNPSSVHAEGRVAREAIAQARGEVARVLGTRASEVVFTNGVTEAINLALLGVPQGHVVAAATEHQAALKALQARGGEVTFIPVDEEGRVAVDDVLAAIRPDTVLVTLMFANNEIGTVAPIAEIGKRIAKLRREAKTSFPVFHTDAAQAACFYELNVDKLHVDLMSLSGQKMYGPKATGALYVRDGVQLAPVLFGGRQEHGLRPGTENVPGIIGFAKALTIAQEERAACTARMAALRDMLFAEVAKAFPTAVPNGAREERLPNNVNVAFPGVDGEALVMYLDAEGIAAATSSSCTSGTGMSHVLQAMGLPEERLKGSIRLTLGRGSEEADIPAIIVALKKVVPLVQTR